MPNLVRAIAAFVAVTPLFAQYGGPAILARGQAPGAMASNQIDFRPFVSVSGIYSAGLNGVSVDAKGLPVNDASFGVGLTFGVSGSHSWKRTRVGLNYASGFSHYQKSFYSGLNSQNLQLSLVHQLSRHSTFNFNNSLVLYGENRATPTLPTTLDFDPSTNNIPTNDFYDNRTLTASSTAGYTIQRSARLSFSFAGNAFLTRRRSSALYGAKGLGAQGDMMYRLTRNSTVGAMYTYIHYNFTGIAGGTDAHAVSGVYSRILTRHLQMSAFGGFTKFENVFIQTVPVDPAIAAVIGIGSVQRVFYINQTFPTGGGRISWTVPRGTFFANASSNLNPGNGLFLTSIAVNAGAGYNYTGLRHWALSAGTLYNASSSKGNVYGNYGSYSANLSASRQVARYTHGVMSFYTRKYISGDFKNYNKWAYGINLGLSFAPGDIPIRLW
ncbi:MAG: hypothetical protein ABI806_10860 [Candidatus Solibacter sp.]